MNVKTLTMLTRCLSIYWWTYCWWICCS